MKLLVVDDHPIVRSGLRRLLSSEPGTEIAEAPDGESAVKAFREGKPDLVILDLNLPGLSGLEVMGQIKGESPDARFLVISMYDSPLYVARVLEAGARGYVSKNAPPEQILEAVRRTAVGRPYIEHEIAQEVALWNVSEPSHPLKQLSPRYIEIMRLLADGNSLTEIARALGVSYKTVANQCSQLKSKLGMPRTADLVRLAISCRLGRGDGRLSASLSLDARPQPR
jgi:two-component system, NarL family, invasion response regulator UvrY